jgi:SAM-dependent methyltransferase
MRKDVVALVERALAAYTARTMPLIAEQVRSPLREDNKLRMEDHVAHDWYRFVLSYPAHLVRNYLRRFGVSDSQTVLDPFCGTGTTLVECKRLGITSIGIEPNPVAAFASAIKVSWDVDPDGLMNHARNIAKIASTKLVDQGIADLPASPLFGNSGHLRSDLKTLPAEAFKLLLTDSISPLPLHKTLVLLETLAENQDERFTSHERLALAHALVTKIGNLHFGPEVGVGEIKQDTCVLGVWLAAVNNIANDLRALRENAEAPSIVHRADARDLASILDQNSVDAVITSPPYPNEKDYTRTTRLESVLLGFIQTKDDLRALKQSLVRSNTRSVYKSDTDDRLVRDHEEIQRIAAAIEARRIELGKTSGFEKLYARVTQLYFGGMTRHLLDLRSVLRPGAQLAYVVGDQASYLRVMLRTGQLLAGIAKSIGYEVVGIDLFRTRLATATKEQLREEVVVLRWPGSTSVAGWSQEQPEEAIVKENPKNMYKAGPKKPNRYAAIIEDVFFSKYKTGGREVAFERVEVEACAKKLRIALPKNLGDLVYSFRYRANLPAKIVALAKAKEVWVIRPVGRGKYKFALIPDISIVPNEAMAVTKVPDSTPGVVIKYGFDDEQALLAKLRYNRLVDIFTGVTCYSLQNHLRTTTPEMGQVETDEIYIGVDKKGAHYVFPIQAKGGTDKLNVVQIEQDFAVCAAKFPLLVCRPIAAQFMEHGVIALFEFEQGAKGVGISSEKHYKLVPPKEVTDEDLKTYASRTSA